MPADHLLVLVGRVAPHAHEPLPRRVDVGLHLGELLLPHLGGVEALPVPDALKVLVLVARVDAVVVAHPVVVDRADVARRVGQGVGEVVADEVDVVLGLGVVVVAEDEGVAVGLEEVGDGRGGGAVEAAAMRGGGGDVGGGVFFFSLELGAALFSLSSSLSLFLFLFVFLSTSFPKRTNQLKLTGSTRRSRACRPSRR